MSAGLPFSKEMAMLVVQRRKNTTFRLKTDVEVGSMLYVWWGSVASSGPAAGCCMTGPGWRFRRASLGFGGPKATTSISLTPSGGRPTRSGHYCGTYNREDNPTCRVSVFRNAPHRPVQTQVKHQDSEEKETNSRQHFNTALPFLIPNKIFRVGGEKIGRFC